MKKNFPKPLDKWSHLCYNTDTKEMEVFIMDAELIWWIGAAVVALLFVCAVPFIDNYLKYKDTEKMFNRDWQNPYSVL